VLVGGQGAINRDGNRGGEIVAYKTGEAFGYVCGEAQNAYGNLLEEWRRHLVLLRPSALILVDDVLASKPSTFQWLLHAFERFEIDQEERILISRRKGASLAGRLYASTDLTLSQTDAWPVAPDEGYPTLTRPLPAKRWHFTAETERTDRIRIAAICTVQGPGEQEPDLNVSVQGKRITFRYGQDVTGRLGLSPDSDEVLQVRQGAVSILRI